MEIIPVFLLLAVSLVALELLQVQRRGVSEYRGYVALLIVDLGLLVWSLVTHAHVSWQAWLGVAAAIALVVLPWLCDGLSRFFIERERFTDAAHVAAFRELLVPGRASSMQHQFFRDLADVHSGNSDRVIRRLRDELADAEPTLASWIHERMVATLVLAGRMEEAVKHYQTHFGRVHPMHHPALVVHMTRAYGELGDLERALLLHDMLARSVPSGSAPDPFLQAVLAQNVLQLLAHAGEAELLEHLLATPLGRRLPRELGRRLRRAVTQDNAVDSGAPREAIRREGKRLLAQFLRHTSASHAAAGARRDDIATLAIAGLTVLIHIAIVVLCPGADSYDLIRGGASFHAAIPRGEAWRLVSAIFLHDGHHFHLHLIFNMLSLFVFGRYVEPLFGAARLCVFYFVSGIAGNALSFWMSGKTGAALSLGASGAVFGIVGALIVMLAQRRGQLAEPGRRVLLTNLLLLSGLQLLFGAFMPMIDNWAHVGGAFSGALLGLVLAPGGVLAEGRTGHALLGILSGLVVAALAVAGWSVWHTPVEQTLGRISERQITVGPVVVTVPAYAVRYVPDKADWQGEEVVADPIAELDLAPHVMPAVPGGVDAVLQSCVARDRKSLREEAEQLGSAVPEVQEAKAPALDGWVARAAQIDAHKPLLLYYGRAVDDKRVLVVELRLSQGRRHRELRLQTMARYMASLTPVPPPGASPSL